MSLGLEYRTSIPPHPGDNRGTKTQARSASWNSQANAVTGFLSTYSFVPQVTKCWKTGDTEAISLRKFAVCAFGLLLWTIHGLAVGSLPALIFSFQLGAELDHFDTQGPRLQSTSSLSQTAALMR
jgi:hypothetical protein